MEAKASAAVTPDMATPMRRLADALARRAESPYTPAMFVVHEHSRTTAGTRAVAPGVTALPWRDFVGEILSSPAPRRRS